MRHTPWVVTLALAAACTVDDPSFLEGAPGGDPTGPDAGPPSGYADPSGYGDTFLAAGPAPANPFFAPLGTNGRTCATCHDVATGWSATPAALQARFDATAGTDPIFRAIDGATSPTADTSTPAARRVAYRLLLARGLIRVGLAVPAGADFSLESVDDPYRFASAGELSLFRRPLPSANLRFNASVMWDGREATLVGQATDAALGHAQASSVAAADAEAAAAFESSVYSAQRFDAIGGDLAADGAGGGPAALAATSGGRGFSLYQGWSAQGAPPAAAARRAAIRRGEQIFDGHGFRIAGVAGLADQRGTCATCHDTPDVGSSSVVRLLDLGISDATRRSGDLPLYTLRRTSDGTTRRSSDPGAALITGRWSDLGKFKVPGLRGLAMRAPYFHNGFAPALSDVVAFYDQRFDMHLSPQERRDLVAFLEAL